MDKVIIEVYVPALDQAFDIFIPLRSQMHEVLSLIKKAIMDLSDGYFVATDETAICYRETGKIINVNMTVFELGIRNGSKLMLI